MKRQKELWQLSLFARWWKIWNERNNHVFNGESKDIYDIMESIVWTVSNWASRDKALCGVSMNDINVMGGVFQVRGLP